MMTQAATNASITNSSRVVSTPLTAPTADESPDSRPALLDRESMRTGHDVSIHATWPLIRRKAPGDTIHCLTV